MKRARPAGGLGHYRGLAFRISLDRRAGSLRVIDDGVDLRTQALLAARKERILGSAFGAEAVCKLCPPAPGPSR